jgi:hypothetical protein
VSEIIEYCPNLTHLTFAIRSADGDVNKDDWRVVTSVIRRCTKLVQFRLLFDAAELLLPLMDRRDMRMTHIGVISPNWSMCGVRAFFKLLAASSSATTHALINYSKNIIKEKMYENDNNPINRFNASNIESIQIDIENLEQPAIVQLMLALSSAPHLHYVSLSSNFDRCYNRMDKKTLRALRIMLQKTVSIKTLEIQQPDFLTAIGKALESKSCTITRLQYSQFLDITEMELLAKVNPSTINNKTNGYCCDDRL